MRIWLVPAKELDDRRLRAQHREFDILYDRMMRGQKWLGWEKPEHRQALERKHYNLRREIDIRGMEWLCFSNFPLYSLVTTAQRSYEDPRGYTADDDRWTLVCRWDGNFKGRAYSSMASKATYDRLILKYIAQGGCLHDGRLQKLDKEYDLCLLCKRAKKHRLTGLIEPHNSYWRRRVNG